MEEPTSVPGTSKKIKILMDICVEGFTCNVDWSSFPEQHMHLRDLPNFETRATEWIGQHHYLLHHQCRVVEEPPGFKTAVLFWLFQGPH